jgi:hypothetical protein
MSYSIVKTLHIVVLAAWLGMEIAVFMLFYRHRDFDGIPVEGRRALAEVHEPIAFGPRIFWMPMLVLGIILATLGDWAFDGTGGVALVGAVSGLAVIWLVGQSYVFSARRSLPRLTNQPRHLAWIKRVEVIDTCCRVLVVAALGGVGVWSILGSGPIGHLWLAWKAILFSVLVGVTLVWKRVGRRIAVERRFVVGLDNGRKPDLVLFRKLTYQAQALLAFFWVLMLAIIWLAVDKP